MQPLDTRERERATTIATAAPTTTYPDRSSRPACVSVAPATRQEERFTTALLAATPMVGLEE
jgi:hypothetical protein